MVGLRAIAAVVAMMLIAVLVVPAPASAGEAGYRTSAFGWTDVCPDGLPWTGDEPLRIPARGPRDAAGVPMYRVGGRLYYRPGALAINGMKRIDAYRDSGDEAQLDQALKQAERLRKLALARRNAWWLPFWYDYLPAGQEAPWFNAMTQGLVLSFFVRLYLVTGDEVHLDAARQVFRSFRRLGREREPWVAFVDGSGLLWLEHYPRPNPDHVLNAHLHAIFGIYEYWQATRSPAARRLLNGAATTMRRRVGRYRQPGGVSIYGLRSRTQNPKYHEIHIWQLDLLALISGDAYFARIADQLREDRRPVGKVNGRPARNGPAIVGPQCRPEMSWAPNSETAEPSAPPIATG